MGRRAREVLKPENDTSIRGRNAKPGKHDETCRLRLSCPFLTRVAWVSLEPDKPFLSEQNMNTPHHVEEFLRSLVRMAQSPSFSSSSTPSIFRT